MKQGIHPDYHPVVFRDRAANFAFLTRSTATSERTITWEDGNAYPVIDVEISSSAIPMNRTSISASELTDTPQMPTSPADCTSSASRPMSVGKSNATDNPVWPCSRR